MSTKFKIELEITHTDDDTINISSISINKLSDKDNMPNEVSEVNEVNEEDNNTMDNQINNHEQLIRLVKHFESFYPKAYLDPVKIPTIGYGTIRYKNGNKVKLGDTITKSEAINEMLHELNQKYNSIKSHIKVDLNTNQIDALVSFAYNVGEGALINSTLLKKVNEGKFDEVPSQFMRWINAGGKPLPGLWRRRLAESMLFQGLLNKVPDSSKIPKNYADIKYFPNDYTRFV